MFDIASQTINNSWRNSKPNEMLFLEMNLRIKKSKSIVVLSIALLLVLSVTKLSDYKKCIHCSMKSFCRIASVRVTGIPA